MTARRILQIVLVGLGTSVVPLDTAVNIAFPDITEGFGLPIEMIQWVVICYVLTYASLMLAFGRVGDIFGHGLVFRVGLLWSSTAYLLCAVAPSYGWLLVCRFLQGVGASLIVSCAPALVTGLFAEEKRSRAVSVFTLIYAIGSAVGPLLGGLLVQHWGWSAVFWFRAPIALAPLFFLHDRHASTRLAAAEPLDIVGAVLLALGISALLLMFNQLQHPDRHALLGTALLATAAASLFGFMRWEQRVAEPIVDLDLFQTKGFAALNLASLLIYLTNFAVLLLGPYYLLRVASLSVQIGGAVLAASFAGSIIASPVAAAIIERVTAGRVAALGAMLGGMGLALIGSWDPDAGRPMLGTLGALALQGFGVGIFQVAYMDIVMQTLPRRHRGVAGAIAMLSRSLGVVIGATLLTLLFHAAESFFSGDTFLASFRVTFWLAGAVSGFAGLLVLRATAVRS